MPSKDEHLAKATNNRNFAISLKAATPTAIGWALTVLFYSALHYVEAYNANFGLHCRNHEELNDQVARNPVLEPIRDEYKDLMTFSWNSRYRAIQYTAENLGEAIESHDAIQRIFEGMI